MLGPKLDFMEDLKTGVPGDDILKKHPNSTLALSTLKKLYTDNYNASYSDTPKIPKIIHYFWYGPRMPIYYKGYQ